MELRSDVGASIVLYHPQDLLVLSFDTMCARLRDGCLLDKFTSSMAPTLRSLSITASPYHTWTTLSQLTNLTQFNLNAPIWNSTQTRKIVGHLPMSIRSVRLDAPAALATLLCVQRRFPLLTSLSLPRFHGDRHYIDPSETIVERSLTNGPMPPMSDLVRLQISLGLPEHALQVMAIVPNVTELEATFTGAYFIQRRRTLAATVESIPSSLTSLKISGLSVTDHSNQLTELGRLSCLLQVLHVTMEKSGGPLFDRTCHGLNLSTSIPEVCTSTLTSLAVINYTDDGLLQLPLLPRLQTLRLSTQLPDWSTLPTQCPNLRCLDVRQMPLSCIEFDIEQSNAIPPALVALRQLRTFVYPRVAEFDELYFPAKIAALKQLRDAKLGFTVE